MCKTKKSTEVIAPKSPNSNSRPRRSFTDSIPEPFSNNYATGSGSGSSYNNKYYSSKSSATSRASLSSFKDSLPENPHIYNFSEISAATNNFLSNKFSTSAAWRCNLRDNEVAVFQRKLRRPLEVPELRDRLLSICRIHHSSLIKLLGASLSGNYIYLVYEFVTGANLKNQVHRECIKETKRYTKLHNSRKSNK